MNHKIYTRVFSILTIACVLSTGCSTTASDPAAAAAASATQNTTAAKTEAAPSETVPAETVPEFNTNPMGYDAYNPPVVSVEAGDLRGYMDGGIFSFLGIQYATAGRFEQPRPVEPWQGVKDAQVYGPVCPTTPMDSISTDEFVWPHRYWPQNENCQFLNVWSKDLNPTEKKPVMVFLHGGAYVNGSANETVAYNGRNLTDFGDVVVVTLNHRLNVLGCLNLSAYGEEYANSGNTGMADIVMALQWVQENISHFGGDPDNVTIFGQSGGSGKVVTLMHMPEAQGLFHKAIAESSGTASVLLEDESLRITELTLDNLGLDGSQISQLKDIPYDQLLEAADSALATVKKEVAPSGRNISWRPLQDEKYIMEDFCEFASEIPFIAGTNFSERNSTVFIGDGRKNQWTDEETTANLKERYGENAEEIAAEFARLFPEKKAADAYFYAPSYRNNVRTALSNKMKGATAPVYNYLFAFEAPVNGGITPFHCAELIYVFHNVDLPDLRIATGGTKECYDMQDVVAQAWVNFAYTGNPSQEGLEWKPYSQVDNGTMIFDINSGFRILDDQKMVDLME